MERENAWKSCNKQTVKEIFGFCEGYKKFISECKTERECTRRSIQMAEEHGYRNLKEIIAAKETIKSGDKVYADNMGKAIVLFNIGKKPIEDGLKILGAHIDSPRLDIKQNPLYEDSDLVLMDTHYYGGIKKYQWTTIPLALHGVVALTDGSVIDVEIGEKEKDPVVCVSDLLIHLAAEQMEKNGAKVVEGEALDLVVGNMPFNPKKDEKNPAKAYILDILKKKYRIAEEDFMSAELEAVPAGKARDLGLDASMVLGYGQDDRVCAYTSLMAMLEVEEPEYTSVCLLVDKEEIGSVGATGMQSLFFENMVAEILDRMGCYSELILRRTLANSEMLSSDVNAGFDPNYAYAFEKKNASYLGRGVVFSKFTGSRGKSGSNDANAEYIARVRKALERENVAYQMAELGKVDIGGGGTIAYILAKYGMDVIDCGVAVLSMHAPYEATSKIDIYEAKRGYVAFLNAGK
ncbi:aminopeptidase [Eshraghiella crossota]|uniref:aminopeptidase n=1 Tax=Eshraghiella crossota TaxID=45851 RepID=UPI001DD853F0|nr:aminopeptidase [Butyrivibrio crossotus]